MAVTEYLDFTGLSYYNDKIKNTYLAKTEIDGSMEDYAKKTDIPGPATQEQAGIVKPGTGLTVTEDGTLNAAEVDLSNYVQKTDYATQEQAGVVKPDGKTIVADETGTLSVQDLDAYVKKADLLSMSKEEVDALFSAATAQSSAVITVKTEGTYLGLNYADLGTFTVEGLSISGTAKPATAIDWNGPGQNKTGYFIGLHMENVKTFKTANKPDGKAPDETGDLLLFLGEEAPTLSYIEFVDTADKSDKFAVSVVTADSKKYVTPEGLQEFKTKADELYATKEEVDVKKLQELEQQFQDLLGDSASLDEALNDKFATKEEAATKSEIVDMETMTHAEATYATKEEAATKEELEGIKADIASVYKPQGSIAFAGLEGLNIADNVGNVYNVNEEFTTTDQFLEGPDVKYPSGTNVVVAEKDGEYKFDALSGIYDLTPYLKSEDVGSISNEKIDQLFSEAA